MKARTVCCQRLVDAKSAPVAKNKWGEFLVCNDTCAEFMKMATEPQMKKILAEK